MVERGLLQKLFKKVWNIGLVNYSMFFL